MQQEYFVYSQLKLIVTLKYFTSLALTVHSRDSIRVDPSKHQSVDWEVKNVLLVIAKFTCGTRDEPENYRPINLNSI